MLTNSLKINANPSFETATVSSCNDSQSICKSLDLKKVFLFSKTDKDWQNNTTFDNLHKLMKKTLWSTAISTNVFNYKNKA